MSRPSRLRISLLPPFGAAKYLLPIPQEVTTIADLKRYLVHAVDNISAHTSLGRAIALELEGFEVIDGPLETLRESDVIG
jgi:hypothetical protein